MDAHGAEQIENVLRGVNHRQLSSGFLERVVRRDQQTDSGRVHHLGCSQIHRQMRRFPSPPSLSTWTVGQVVSRPPGRLPAAVWRRSNLSELCLGSWAVLFEKSFNQCHSVSAGIEAHRARVPPEDLDAASVRVRVVGGPVPGRPPIEPLTRVLNRHNQPAPLNPQHAGNALRRVSAAAVHAPSWSVLPAAAVRLRTHPHPHKPARASAGIRRKSSPPLRASGAVPLAIRSRADFISSLPRPAAINRPARRPPSTGTPRRSSLLRFREQIRAVQDAQRHQPIEAFPPPAARRRFNQAVGI